MSFKMTKYNLHIEMQIEFNAFFKDYHKKVKWSIEKGNVVEYSAVAEPPNLLE